MIGKTQERREERVGGILATAWELAREHGIGGVSLHELARAVGIKQPSLYAYFDSKLALYDAMFADGNRQLLERLDALEPPPEPRAAAQQFMGAFIDFAVEDPARYELMFHRPIPGFVPTPESYAIAEAVLARAVELLRAAGLDAQDDIDCYVGMVAGLIEAQISNDPGGDRWSRHLDRLSNLYLDDAKRRRRHR
jgi:AcrR family transcriptional regulator